MRFQCEVLCTGEIGTGTSYYGWPTMIRNRHGELLVVASGRREHLCPYGKIELFRSANLGADWSMPEVLVNGKLDDRDPGLLETPAGTLLVTWVPSIVWLDDWEVPGNGGSAEERAAMARTITLDDLWRERGVWMIRSADNGASWSAPYRIPVFTPHGPMVMADGTLGCIGLEAASSATWHISGGSWLGAPAFAVSKDDGLHWEVISRPPQPPGLCWSEPAAVQSNDGRLVAIYRNDGPGGRDLWQIDSWDGGHTWGTPRRISTGLPPHLAKLRDGRLLLTYGWRNYHGDNWVFPPSSIRARVSTNDGADWSEELVLIEDSPLPDMGYPSTAELDDGSLFTLWYDDRRRAGNNHFLRHIHWRLE